MMIEVKICENCKHQNPVVAVECEKCGYDLTFVYPQMVDPDKSSEEKQANETQVQEADAKWVMIAAADENLICGINEEISVGRDCAPFSDQFNSSNYTSRVHAKIRVMNDVVQIMDASTNGTFIDEKRIPKMEWVEVSDDSIVRFADVAFKIRRNCNAN